MTHPDDPCAGAYGWYEHAGHNMLGGDHEHSYGGYVQTNNGGDLYVTVDLPMTIETTDPLITDTANSQPGSTYRMCWVSKRLEITPNPTPGTAYT